MYFSVIQNWERIFRYLIQYNIIYIYHRIFNSEYLTYFKRKDLNIEKHFGYQRKKKIIEKFNLPEQKIDEIFNIPWKFVNYLSPETTTPMINSNQVKCFLVDFLKINILKNIEHLFVGLHCHL